MAKNQKSSSVSTPKASSTPAPVAPEENDTVALTTEEAANLRELEAKVAQAKVALADLTLRLDEVKGLTRQVSEDMMTYIRNVAKSHNIDPDHESERWNLNTSDMTFYRTK